MTEFLQQQDPNRDWAAELAGVSRIGGKWSMTGEAPAVPAAEPIVQPTVQPHTSIPISSAIPPKRESPSATTPPEPSEPSQTPQQSDSMDIDPISAYYDSDPGERKARRREEQKSREGGDEPERTPVAEFTPQEMARVEIDLNETARKQGLMTDEEFEALLREVTRMEDAMMAEDPDLKSRVVGEGEEDSAGNKPIEEEKTVARTEVPEPVAPPVIKPEAVKRKLVLKSDPRAERPKPERVSQRCLGRWASSKAKANTTADPVEVLSEEERTTPTKSGEESLSATDLEDTAMATEVVSPTLSDQGEETEQMAEGLDLASAPDGHDEHGEESTRIRVETNLLAQDQPSTQSEKKPEDEDNRDEDKYQEERKRKGKAPVKRKPSTKKQRTVNIGIVITDPVQRTPPHRQEANDSDYAASEEETSDSDVSLENEVYSEQQLPLNHQELVYPQVERLKYKRWTVELTDELVEEMKLFDSKKLQDAFKDKDDGCHDRPY
ncbi:titin-like [Salvia splendens]|uniref:titin-like n=1 Tax=Salvia splendens TaxID=180675 RepID=UPI001C277181|nr:titin-like [Salvia splendens]